METKNLRKKLAAVIVCLATVFAVQAVKTTAVTFADLQSQFTAASASGVRDTINIGGAIVVNADFSMVSTGDTVIINMVPYGISVTTGTLTIGNKVKVMSAYTSAGAVQAAGGNVIINAGSNILASTGNTIQALAGGTVTVNGGTIYSTSTSPVIAAGGNVTINGGKIMTVNNYPSVGVGMSINALPSGGTLTINGGYIITYATGVARGVGIDYGGVCYMNGGEVHSDMGGGRGISINNSNSGGKLYVNGGTISALGGGATGGRAIQADNGNAFVWISGSPVITGGTEAIIAQKYGIVVVSGTPTITGVIGTNLTTATPAWNPVLYDARAINITATPTTGYYAASQTVTVASGTMSALKYTGASSGGTGAGVTNPVTITPTTLVYTTDGTYPLATSTTYSAPVTMPIPSALNVAPIIEGTVVGATKVFNYWTIGTPMASAPTPTAPANKVLSLFSDAYQSADPGTNFFPNWSQSTQVSTIKINSTDNVLKYANLNYEGTELAKHMNVADMKYMHVDLFTPTLTTFKIGPISPGPKETDAILNLTTNQWNSFDIPVSTFTGVNLADIFQLGSSGANGTIYLDNIYFWTDLTDTQAPTGFTAAAGVIASDAVELLLNATDNSGAVFYDITYGTTTVTASGASGVQKSFIVTSLIGSTNYSFSIVARDRSGNAVGTPIVVSATTLASIPGAPVPTLDASKVISIFSDTYTNIAATDFYPGWGQNTLASAVSLSGNNAMKYANFNYQGIVLGSHVDASGMNKLHVDIYPIDETSIGLTPISPAHEKPTLLGTLIPNQWNSFNILLTTYTGVIFSDIYQFKFDQGTGKTFYMDNLYFFNDAASNVATIGTSSIKCYPSQVISSMSVTADSEISNVIVRNLIGQTIKSVTVNSPEKSIDLSAVSAGNYFVTVKLANGQSATQKIVKL